MSSNPPGVCCTRGVFLEGESKGRTTKTLDGKTDIYVAVPPPGSPVKKAAGILLLPDIYGIHRNSEILADSYAAQGYTTMVLDLFNGDPAKLPLPAGFQLARWIAVGSNGKDPHTPEAIDPVIVEGIKTLKSYGVNRIGAVAYCFGAKYLMRHYKSGIDVGYTAHPSFVTDEELAGITGPLSIAAAETDHIFSKEGRHKSEEILQRTSQPYQINLFSGVSHGFATRGDPNDRVVRFAKEQAFRQAVAWFDEYLVDA